MGDLDVNGYGVFRDVKDGRRWSGKAYRIAFELINGPVPSGLRVRHCCDNRRCCNPRHLIPGTRADNTRDHYASKRALAAIADAHKEAA